MKLQRVVNGYPFSGNPFQFNLKLTYELSNIVKRILAEQMGDRQILVLNNNCLFLYLRCFNFARCHWLVSFVQVFCQSRNDVESSLSQLLKSIRLPMCENRRTALKNVAERYKFVGYLRKLIEFNMKYRLFHFSINDTGLKSSMAFGMAFHHAGLSSDDREHVENAYRRGWIRILLSTNTLAMGVNLPAHTIIIKNTEVSEPMSSYSKRLGNKFALLCVFSRFGCSSIGRRQIERVIQIVQLR